ncbi:MAG: hypothetical protein M1834_001136 [Cirrosporium novae-zelandiae]|nr:MAG: hypothetical protein M1834_001136 [Cirrosporium novae-zelandiae]
MVSPLDGDSEEATDDGNVGTFLYDPIATTAPEKGFLGEASKRPILGQIGCSDQVGARREDYTRLDIETDDLAKRGVWRIDR